MAEVYYGVMESIYKIEGAKLVQIDADTLFKYSIFANKEDAISKVKETIKDGGDEVTNQIPEELLNQLPKIDGIEDFLELYKVVKMRNVILTYKVIQLNVIN